MLDCRRSVISYSTIKCHFTVLCTIVQIIHSIYQRPTDNSDIGTADEHYAAVQPWRPV
nr:MAG TPA: hypothetical protein [Caudoviricetes sp.]